MTMSTPEPPAPTPSATTRCAWCDRHLPLGAWTYCSADCKQEAWLHSIVPPASAPAATAGVIPASPDTTWYANYPLCAGGRAARFTRPVPPTKHCGDPSCPCMSAPPAAPTGEEAETPKFEHRGWPATRATSLAVSAFTGNTKLILGRVRNGEAIELTQRGAAVAVLVPRKQYDRFTAQATELAALRARVEELQQQGEGWTKKDQQQEPKPKGESPNA